MNEGKGREIVLKRLKWITAILLLLSIILLLFAGLGVRYYSDDIHGPPYYLGGFVVGIPAFFTGMVGLSVLAKAIGKGVNDIRLKDVAPRISILYTVLIILLSFCFVGLLLTCTGSFAVDEDHRPRGTNEFFATVILIACIMTSLVVIFALFTVCIHGKYFGVHFKRGRRTVVIEDASTYPNTGAGATGCTTGASVQTNVNIFTTNVQHQPARRLEEQNRLLEHQLYLQQKMLNQQQQLQQQQQQQQQQRQQQGQFSGGTYPPPQPSPPPYTSNPVYPPPTAPPPTYEKS